MSRRRSTPWIHRWSRLIIAAIAAVGAIGTAYLTVIKLSGATAACPTSGCEQVLSSPYATVLGLPLTLFGFLAYTSMGVFALAPLAVNPEEKKELRSNLEKWTWLLMFAIATAMVVFSGYLMYLLAFKIKALCLYCLASALFSVSFFVLTLIGRAWDDVGQLFFTGIVVGMVTLIGTLGVYARIDGPAPTTGSNGPAITTTSTQAELALANHLKQVGAKMYGAYWCPHCHDQKQLFGKEAFRQVTYIECAPDGKNARPDLCQAAKIEGFPSWEVNGKLYPGTQSLEKLANASGYQGPRNFQNVPPPGAVPAP
jgi:uncharacterized membrane protein